jgi:hypothetical protein
MLSGPMWSDSDKAWPSMEARLRLWDGPIASRSDWVLGDTSSMNSDQGLGFR